MNTPHETADSIERSAYDSAMIEEAKEKWEIDFDKLFSEYVITYGRPNGDLFMSENATPEGIKDFIRTQRSLAQQEILGRVMEIKPKRKVFVPNIGFAGLTMLESGFNNAVDEFDEKLSTLKDTNI